MDIISKKKVISLTLILSLIFTFSSHTDAKQNANKVRTFKVKKLERKNNKIVYRKFLDTSVPYIGADRLKESSIDGKGYAIVILDSGIYANHPMVSGKVIQEACFTTDKSCPNFTNRQIGKGAASPTDWHGTHVAGIAAGSANDIVGVAPGASIIPVNVFDKDESSSESAIAEALKWVLSISDDYKIAAINMSLGSSRLYNNYCDNVSPDITSVIHKLYDKNIPVVAATGNSYSLGMANPACISKVVSVAAMTETGVITSFSNLSDKTTFAAPGYQIKSAAENNTYRISSGTSMASPHVAGVFALYKQVHSQHSISTALSNLISISSQATDQFSKLVVPAINVSKLLETGNNPPTTTTLPIVDTTPSTQPQLPTIPTIPIKPLFKPYLMKVYTPTSSSEFFYIKYQDTFAPKGSVANYILECGTSKFDVPYDSFVNSHVYKVPYKPSFESCFMYGILKDQTISAYSSSVFLTKG